MSKKKTDTTKVSGKKFKLNIIDVIVIFLIVILVCASIVKFRNYNETGEENSRIDTIVYNVKISNIRNYTVDAFEIGDVVYDSQMNVEIGKIIDKKYVEAKGYEALKSGEIIETKIPNKYDMILTLEAPGLISENGYYANKSVEIKVGSEKIIETLYAKSGGMITDILQSENVEDR